MLVEQYDTKGLLFNKNLSGQVGEGEIYRGDLVLKYGEVTDRGDRKPPSIVAKQGVFYALGDKLVLLAAGLDKLEDLEMIVEHYQGDYAEECKLIFFVHDIKHTMQVLLNGFNYLVEPLDDGMIWNEILEVLCIEKSDLKGQSAEEKVVTVYKELCEYTAKSDIVNFEDALGMTIEVKASARGPV